MNSRKTIACSECGASMCVGVESVSGVCWHCTDKAVRTPVYRAEPEKRRRGAYTGRCSACGVEIPWGAGPRCALCLPGPAAGIGNLVRGECANWVSGICVRRADATCILLETPTQRCDYFECAVLPLGDADLRRRYYKRYGIDYDWREENPGRVCPDCGAELPPRKKVCKKCQRERRRATFRKANDRRKAPSPDSVESDGMSVQQISENPPA